MQIGSSLSTGAFAPVMPASSSSSPAASDPLTSIAPSGDTSADLMKFLKMSPAQKMEYQWMSSHHITQQSLAAMTPDQRNALQQRMESDLKQKAQQTLESKTAQANGGVNIVV